MDRPEQSKAVNSEQATVDKIPFISLSHISHSYPEGNSVHTVLRDVSLEMAEGEKLALLGRSGSGKSTLLNLVSGIDLPASGTVRIGGKDITGMNETARTLYRRRHIGFIYQFFNLVPSLTALENVAFILALNGVGKKESMAKSAALLSSMGIGDRCDKFPAQLSGGEQQRVAIARALVHAPAIVLADEPTGNLDAKTGAGVLETLLQMNQSTLLIVTHSLAVAKNADRIITLEDGNLSERDGDFAW